MKYLIVQKRIRLQIKKKKKKLSMKEKSNIVVKYNS